jgi:glycosyltransferase involved in cell wall biosynthesis
MVAFPPAGYEFVVSNQPAGKWVKAAARLDMARFLLKASDGIIPTALAKSWLDRWNKPLPDAVLTYAVDHLVFRPEPWVVEVEYASALVGIHPKHFKRFKHVTERALASPYCRRILCWSEASRRSLLTDLDSQRFHHKSEVVHYAVPPAPFAKEYRDGKIKLLFVGSGTSKGVFEGRGSEVFEVFVLLCQQYRNLELVVRSDVPAYVKALYGGMENLRIMDKIVPRDVLEREFQSADIFLFPSYHTLPLTILEAMSYELPVVTIGSWANAEYVEHGKTGLVAPRSRKVPDHFAGTRQPNFLAPSFPQAMRTPDREAVAALVATVALLIEHPELRQRLGKAARWEVEQGKFSLARMSRKLTQIFDEAVGQESDRADAGRIDTVPDPANP